MKDESGRPFIIVREYVVHHQTIRQVYGIAGTNIANSQGNKKRQHGNDAVKSHILAAKTVSNIVRTSLVGMIW